MSAVEHEIKQTEGSRALVALEPPRTRLPARTNRAAPFLAHLIATRTQAPQTRTARRAEPAEAIARYRAVAGMMKSRAG